MEEKMKPHVLNFLDLAKTHLERGKKVLANDALLWVIYFLRHSESNK